VTTPIVNRDYHSIFYTDRNGMQIAFLVIHGTGGSDSRVTLQKGDGRGVSIHGLDQKFPRANGSTDIVKGQAATLSNGTVIYEMLPDELGANHAGFSRATVNGRVYEGSDVNRASLGLELENKQDRVDPYTDGQLLAMGWWINSKRAKYGHLPVFRHEDIDYRRPKQRYDPVGLSVNDIESWCVKAANVSNDLWALWGSVYDLHKEWAIPQAWYKRARLLGECQSNEYYQGNIATQIFANGFCVYSKLTGRAKAFLYAEI